MVRSAWLLAVEGDHGGVIHLVDVVAGQDQGVARGGLLDRVDVLIDGVGGALVPVLGDALLGRDDLDVLVQLAAEEAPALVDVAGQADGLVLGQDEDLADVGVDAIGEGEVDDAIDPAEGDGGLGAVARQGLQARPAPPRQDDRQHVSVHPPPLPATGPPPLARPEPLCAAGGGKPTGDRAPLGPSRRFRGACPQPSRSPWYNLGFPRAGRRPDAHANRPRLPRDHGTRPPSIARSADPDTLRDLQLDAVAKAREKAPRAYHFGSQGAGDVFSNHDGHTNRLIPIYTFGRRRSTSAPSPARNSAYRDAAKVRKMYGFLPENTVNPDAQYADQGDLYRVLKDAVGKQGVETPLFVVWFDGMDWETTRAAAVVEVGQGLRLGQGLGPEPSRTPTPSGSAQFGCVRHQPDARVEGRRTSTPSVPPGSLVRRRLRRRGSPGRTPGRSGPWARRPPPATSRGSPPPMPSSRRSATPAASCTPTPTPPPARASSPPGVKSYNHGINVGEDGKPLPTLFNDPPGEGGLEGRHRHERPVRPRLARRLLRPQRLPRRLPGPRPRHARPPRHRARTRRPPSSRTRLHPGLDVVIGAGLGHEAKPEELAKQGKNAVEGKSLYLADDDLEKVDVRNGGKYVVARRTPGVEGRAGLQSTAADRAARDGRRLFGFYGGNDKDHLPYRTADGQYDPVHGLRSRAETYSPADLRENPTLADMTEAALTRPQRAWTPRRPSPCSSRRATSTSPCTTTTSTTPSARSSRATRRSRLILRMGQGAFGDWDDSAMIVTADHGHYLVLDDPKALISGVESSRSRPEGDNSAVESKLWHCSGIARANG